MSLETDTPDNVAKEKMQVFFDYNAMLQYKKIPSPTAYSATHMHSITNWDLICYWISHMHSMTQEDKSEIAYARAADHQPYQ